MVIVSIVGWFKMSAFYMYICVQCAYVTQIIIRDRMDHSFITNLTPVDVKLCRLVQRNNVQRSVGV